MSTVEQSRPWEELFRLLEDGNVSGLTEFIESLPADDVARAVCRLDIEQQSELFSLLTPKEAAEVIEDIPSSQAAEVIERLPAREAASIVTELPSSEQADLLGGLTEENVEAILAEMDPGEAKSLRQLASYPVDTAGGVMITEYVAYGSKMTVGQVISDLDVNREDYARYDIQYIYVVSANEELLGVLRLRDLVVSRRSTLIYEIMIASPLCVAVDADLDKLRLFFEEHNFFGVPVIDGLSRLVGVVQRSAVQEAFSERTDSDHMKRQGIVGGEEFRTMPLFHRSSRRLSWLSLNIVLNLVSASVIAVYQDTLSSVIALAVFLPIISDMSGCSGNQAVAVSMRELAIGLVRPFEVVHVWLKEVSVGLINGLVLGVIIAAVAWLWKGNPFLGVVVGSALAVNTVVAVSIGGTVPLILKRFRLDPALASGPILTTVTDMCGFFLVLSLATALLPVLLVP